MLGDSNPFDKIERLVIRVTILAVLLIDAVEIVLRAASHFGGK